MKIVVIDKDPLNAQFIKSKLEPLGHKITSHTSKSEGAQFCIENEVDLVILDPSPLNTPRTLIQDLRRNAAFSPYTVMISQTPPAQTEALKFGINDVLAKPFNPETLDEKVEQAKYFNALIKRMADDLSLIHI